MAGRRGLLIPFLAFLLATSSLGVAQKAKKVVVLLGAPASGKGTVASKLMEKYGYVSIVASDLLKKFASSDTKEGKQIKDDMANGKLISDDTVLGLIKERLQTVESNVLFDGFPRTVAQAEGLQDILSQINTKLDSVIYFNTTDDILLKRATGRLVHLSSGRSYHTEYKQPKIPLKDDITGEDLVRRTDDEPAVVKKRLVTFREQTTQLIPFYTKLGLLHTIDASVKPDKVYKQVTAVLSPNVATKTDGPSAAKSKKFMNKATLGG